MIAEKKKYDVDIKDKCFHFSIKLFELLREIEKSKLNSVLIDQLARSGTSIGANVVESQASSSTKELIRYYRIALKSTYESAYWLKILQFFTKQYAEKFDELIFEAEEIRKIVTTIIFKLEQKMDDARK
jgi:four helix bundle protein